MNGIQHLTLNPDALSTKLLYQPLINVLFWLYAYLPGHDLGVAIIAFTLLIRLMLFPSYLKTMLNAQRLKDLEPRIKKLREDFKDDQKRQAEEIMKLYREHKVNPVGGCLPLLIQLPFLFALYRIFAFGLNGESLKVLYSWVPRPEVINHSFLGILDLSQRSWQIALLAAIFQLIQGYLSLKSSAAPQMKGFMNLQMLLIFPAITFFIAWSLPSAVGLFWAASTLVAAIQQWYVVLILRRQRQVSA